MMNKNAVSPLIATVLLVMITVSIGAAIMVVIQGLVSEQTQSVEQQSDLLECGVDVDVDLITVSSKYRMCLNVTNSTIGNVTLYMKNTGTKDITGWQVTVLGDDGANSTTYTTDLTTGTLGEFSFRFGSTGDNNGEVSFISISPQIAAATTITCTKPELEFDEETVDTFDDCSAVTWDNGIAATS